MTAHPSIWQVGTITDGQPTGWGLGLCRRQCLCHRGRGGTLTIHQGDDGSLGLHRYRPCGCCTPWTAQELAAILADLDVIAALETA